MLSEILPAEVEYQPVALADDAPQRWPPQAAGEGPTFIREQTKALQLPDIERVGRELFYG
jgi:hypothetical protein